MLFWVTREASKSTKLKNIYFKFYFYPVYANPYTLKYMCTGICVCGCAHTWTYMQWATRLSMLILLLLWSCGGWELIKSLLLLSSLKILQVLVELNRLETWGQVEKPILRAFCCAQLVCGLNRLLQLWNVAPCWDMPLSCGCHCCSAFRGIWALASQLFFWKTETTGEDDLLAASWLLFFPVITPPRSRLHLDSSVDWRAFTSEHLHEPLTTSAGIFSL